uniref:Ixodegrin B n=1 Tax=Rhipicephalus appendiculatus TaxID=34631 RepID=A0A131YS82_RHIAP
MACLLVLVGAIALCLCRTYAAEEKSVGASCDGNEECGPEKCCYRPGYYNGTVCGNLGEENESCSNVTLTEYSTQPSCRADKEAEESVTETYTHPYDGACPCKKGLVCQFNQKKEISARKDVSPENGEASVVLGTCVKPNGDKKSSQEEQENK